MRTHNQSVNGTYPGMEKYPTEKILELDLTETSFSQVNR